ncbi:hypothetical protein DXX93_03635 [Thalassotalea euphylliae]|uniref:Uncharacterized protein n=1 Tax=Thalassotalea euphylliae TaxID=1655234 RepID=A0A3E0TMV6_9GAMM|nr:hypothetical protein [Thalassotalea euphylliae]REL25733.1 hypothetical protein DXX93_03635 [Thalassotalea euphylliae]
MTSKLKEYKEVSPASVKTILKSFFGASYASRITINDKVVKLTWEMVRSSQSCSKMMDLVPRPAGTIPGAGYIAKQLAQLGKRIATAKDDSIYILCKNGAAYRYSRQIQMASNGL